MGSEIGALLDGLSGDGLILLMTGAGVSAESGIPTFRGEEGYWTVGSVEYRPEELATRAAFLEMPMDVWQWYLYRRSVCRCAEPNAAHRAIVELEATLGDRFRLITQNVDGLHLRAGSSLERTYQIHGNIDYMRCAEFCSTELTAIPEGLGTDFGRDDKLAAAEAELLRCPRCGAMARPHVLWFDETYDEPLFRFQSSLEAASRAALLVNVGSSGTTNLPAHVAQISARAGAIVVDINPSANPFSELAEALPRGHWIKGTAAEALPGLLERVRDLVDSAT